MIQGSLFTPWRTKVRIFFNTEELGRCRHGAGANAPLIGKVISCEVMVRFPSVAKNFFNRTKFLMENRAKKFWSILD